MGSDGYKCHVLPLKVVFGSLADVQPSFNQNQDSSPPATYILSTSYCDYTKYKTLNKDGRVLMEDRKGPFEHFRPKNLVLSVRTIRVTAINISTTLSTYFSDQLKSEQRIEDLVDSGKLTPHEADELNEEWEEREWKLRTDALPKKIGFGILRYHTITALMRFYEFVFARYIMKIDCAEKASVSGSNSTDSSISPSYEHAITVMDKLTRDPYQASRRTSQLLINEEHAPGKVLSADGVETTTRRQLMSRMFSTCLWANVMPFLAELTVQQGVLFYGYGIYYFEKKRKRKEREERWLRNQNKECDTDNKSDEEETIADSVYALSIMLRSSHLSIARTMSWIVASTGGAIGSIIWPGWGTVFGIQFGDSIFGSMVA